MSFKKIMSISAVLFSVLALSSCSNSADGPFMVVTEPVVRSVDPMSTVNEISGKAMTGSFMTIMNHSGDDVTLVGGSSPVAGIVEIHEVINGEMVPMSGGLVVPANGQVELRMGGYHVMLLELNETLVAGDEVEVTLEFSNGEKTTYTAPVKDIAMDDEKYGAKAGM
jgi:copper(I)-binding protein